MKRPWIKRMCLGTFSRRGAVASATIYPCAECASSRSVLSYGNEVSYTIKKILLHRMKKAVARQTIAGATAIFHNLFQ